MPNLRILYNNAVDRNSSISANTAALPASNLAKEGKTSVWRSTNLVANPTVTVTWAGLEPIGCVILPWTNLTAAATIRVRAFTLEAANPAVDTPLIDQTGPALRAGPASVRGLPAGVNSFSYGGGSCAIVWLASEVNARKLVIELIDAANPAGYVEAARLLCGRYWSPARQADLGVTLTYNDQSIQSRADSGDLRTDRGTRHKSISLSLSKMQSTDRDAMWEIMRGNGMTFPLFLSLLANNGGAIGTATANEEDIYQIYGKLSKASALSYQYIDAFDVPMEIEGM